MNILSIEHPRFNSNIYVYRSHLSDWLSNYVYVRFNEECFPFTPDSLKLLDEMLIKYHYKFEEIKKTIEILEKDVFRFE